MGYEVYLDKMLLPVTPSKIEMKIKNNNKTYNLINEGEINILKNAGLTEISFDATFPNVKYPYAVYKSGFVTANQFLSQLELFKTNKKPFQFIITRLFPNNKSLYSTNIKVSLEDYTIKEESKQGLDVVVTIKLKQYKDYGTKTCNVTIKQAKPVATTTTTRPATTSPAPTSTQPTRTYTVKSGDCLWNIAKKYYGNGSLYTKIFNANRDKIKNANLIYPGQVFVIPY